MKLSLARVKRPRRASPRCGRYQSMVPMPLQKPMPLSVKAENVAELSKGQQAVQLDRS
jgi:hypothetical protein